MYNSPPNNGNSRTPSNTSKATPLEGGCKCEPVGSLQSLTGPWIVLFAWNPTPAHLETMFPKFSPVVTAFADRVWHNFLEMKYCGEVWLLFAECFGKAKIFS